jgi:hypothetical protein
VLYNAFCQIILHPQEFVECAVVTCFSQFHSCALLSGGAVKCWGRNQYGQVGHFDFYKRSIGVAIGLCFLLTALCLCRLVMAAKFQGGPL